MDQGPTIALLSIDFDSLSVHPSKLFERLSLEERQRADKIWSPEQRELWVGARASLRLLLARYYGLPADELEFLYNEWGKPSVANSTEASHLQFNYSHAGSRALLALSTAGAVGVDIELIKPVVEMESIAGRFFSDAEQADLAAQPEPQQVLCFFRIWTRKEAYLKAVGTGLSGGLAGLDVSTAISGKKLLLAVDGNATPASKWTLADIQVGGNYAAAVAVCANKVSIAHYSASFRSDTDGDLELMLNRTGSDDK